jgi:hypothetical protein
MHTQTHADSCVGGARAVRIHDGLYALLANARRRQQNPRETNVSTHFFFFANARRREQNPRETNVSA